MRYAVIEDGRVANIVEAGPGYAPAGRIVVPAEDAAIGWTWDGGAFSEPAAPTPTPADVIAERERRLAAGFDYDFADERGTHRVGTTPADMAGWDEVTKVAGAMLALGGEAQTIQIVTETGPVTLTALEWQAILVAAGALRQPIWAASFALQTMDPIPADFRDDQYWP